MKVAITGGGTGGHVYPALEVARALRAEGFETPYLGSLRGQEGAACRKEDVPFYGFASEPLYSIRTLKGLRTLARLLRASGEARKVLARVRPDAVFSTGGYSSAPVVRAARSLNVPYVLFEANSVPGRSIRLFMPQAVTLATAFHATEKVFGPEGFEGARFPGVPGLPLVRTGMPIRQALREAAYAAEAPRREGPPRVLVVGGSQGSEFLNRHVPEAVASQGLLGEWLHVTGPRHETATRLRHAELGLGDHYVLRPFLQAEELARAYLDADLIVARSGGSLADFALFRRPSVLIPLRGSADDHQRFNALEFERMGAAETLGEAEFTSEKFAETVRRWLEDAAARGRAAEALASWDRPDATERIRDLVIQAASEKR